MNRCPRLDSQRLRRRRVRGLQCGVTGRNFCDGKRTSLFARVLAGRRRHQLQPLFRLCVPGEMPAEKVVAFFLGYAPDSPRVYARLRGFVRRMCHCPPSRRGAQFAPLCPEGSSPSRTSAINAVTDASAAAVHIRCRYASTTVTDARADAQYRRRQRWCRGHADGLP